MTRRIAVLIFTFAFAWSGLAALYGQVPAPRIGCRIEQPKITTGEQATLTIFADQLPPLTAYNLTITFNDPFALNIQDQDVEREGTNLLPSQAFDAESITQNLVDQPGGKIQLAASQTTASSLSGHFDTLATTTIAGVSDTIVAFHITQATLNDQNGALMQPSAYALQDCFVEIGDSGSPTPIPTATVNTLSPLISPTPTPVGHTSVPPTPESLSTWLAV